MLAVSGSCSLFPQSTPRHAVKMLWPKASVTSTEVHNEGCNSDPVPGSSADMPHL